MLREKEIEEMARVMANGRFIEPDRNQILLFAGEAETLYNAGYRKQSEVVMEIFDDILKIKGLELHDWEAIFELKKKYTDGR